MNLPPAKNSILSRISSVLTGRDATAGHQFTAKQVADTVRLDFPKPQLPSVSIHWKQNLNLQHLINLPRKALSGPVQEDKAAAHRFLQNIVTAEEYTLSLFELRDIYGVDLNLPEALHYESLEDIAGSELCRTIRIISMRDFSRVLNQAVPNFEQKKTIHLNSASWLGLKYFWASELNSPELVSAIVYARRRGLSLQKAAKVQRATLNEIAIKNLQQFYHALVMPSNAWSENTFMQYLVNSRVPYARLPLFRGKNPIEILLLPRSEPPSDTLGQGLRKAGAQDAADFLLKLSSIG